MTNLTLLILLVMYICTYIGVCVYVHIHANIWKDIHQTDIDHFGERGKLVYLYKGECLLFIIYTFLHYLSFVNNEYILHL